ncbi:MAG: DUF5666 domain-containing protein [Rhodospirillales bacterium]
MTRAGLSLCALLILAGCARVPSLPRPAVDTACGWRPDGGPPIVDRGIGGTGAPIRQADRGIGGTGIVGIVAGFASICVDGLEVAYAPDVPVEIDGAEASADALRVGQVVAIAAAPLATRVVVRHEVTGPVEGAGDGSIVVAGQRVRVTPTTLVASQLAVGAWVAVSGIRGGDGDIVASRIDPTPMGPVRVHGPLIASDGTAWIGALAIEHIAARRDEGGGDSGDLAGSYVVAIGTYANGALKAAAVSPDVLVNNPPAFFGPTVSRIAIASYARFDGGIARLTGGFEAPLAPGFVPPNHSGHLVAVSLEMQPNGVFGVVGAQVVTGVAMGAALRIGADAGHAGLKMPSVPPGGAALARPPLSSTSALVAGAAAGAAMGGAIKGAVSAPIGPAGVKPFAGPPRR